MSYNIVDAARDAMKGELRFVADSIYQSRMAVCETCEFRRGPICGKCGCVLRGKAKLAPSSCPVDRWQATTGTESSPAVSASPASPAPPTAPPEEIAPDSPTVQPSSSEPGPLRTLILLTSRKGVAPNAHYRFWESRGCKIRVMTAETVSGAPEVLRDAVVAVVEDFDACDFLQRQAPENRPRAAVWIRGRKTEDPPSVAAFTHRTIDLMENGKPVWEKWSELWESEP